MYAYVYIYIYTYVYIYIYRTLGHSQLSMRKPVETKLGIFQASLLRVLLITVAAHSWHCPKRSMYVCSVYSTHLGPKGFKGPKDIL